MELKPVAGYINLTGPQRIRLKDALRAAFATANDFADLLTFFNLRLEDQGAFNDPYPAKILASIGTLEGTGQILAFVERAHRTNAADPDLKQIYDELSVFIPPAPATSPFEVCVLSGGHIMVNRTTLRSMLKELCTANGRRILVVRDDPAIAAKRELRIKTGKSHTLQMISYLDQVTGGFDFFRIDLEELNRAVRSGEQIQPYDIAKPITQFMGCRQLLEDPPVDGQWSRWSFDFCNNFEPIAKHAAKTWIVIDSFHVTLLPQDTIDLLKQLATRINVSLPNLRLILIGYPGVLPPSIPVAHEVLDVFGEEALVEFFARALQEKQIALSEEKVARKVAAVLLGLNPKQPDYVEQVCARAIAELEQP